MIFKTNNKFFKGFVELDKKTKLLLLIGLLGVILIVASEFFSNSDKEKGIENNCISEQNISEDETEIYKQQIQKELMEILNKIEGVGKCEVMITVEGTTEYVYAENLNDYTDNDGTKQSNKHENNIVMIEENGEKKALVKKIIKPKINGVVVVCEGGDDVRIKERVLKAASTALNISTGKICVESKTE